MPVVPASITRMLAARVRDRVTNLLAVLVAVLIPALWQGSAAPTGPARPSAVIRPTATARPHPGRVAHAGTIAELAHLEPPTPPSEYAELPAEVDDVVLRGLAPDRDDRWPYVRSFVEALQETSPGRAGTVLIPAPDHPRHAGRASEPSGSRGLFALLCLGVLVVCFAVALVVTLQVR